MSNDNRIYDRLKHKIAEKCLKANIDWNENVIFGMSRNGEVRALSTKILQSEVEDFKKKATLDFFFFIGTPDLLSIVPEISKQQFKYDHELWRKLADVFVEGLHRYIKNGYKQVEITEAENFTYPDELKRTEINEIIKNYWKDDYDL